MPSIKVCEPQTLEEKEGVVFYEEVFLYNDIAIAEVSVQENGNVIITDSEGKQYTNTKIAEARAANPDKAIILQDKNGDQVIIKKDGTVEKVPGGGLSGGSGGALAPIDSKLLDEISEIIQELDKTNNGRIDSIRLLAKSRRDILERRITEANVDRELVVGNSDQYINEGFSKAYTKIPKKDTLSDRAEDKEIFAIEDAYVDLFQADFELQKKLTEKESYAHFSTSKGLQEIGNELQNQLNSSDQAKRDSFDQHPEEHKPFIRNGIKEKINKP